MAGLITLLCTLRRVYETELDEVITLQLLLELHNSPVFVPGGVLSIYDWRARRLSLPLTLFG